MWLQIAEGLEQFHEFKCTTGKHSRSSSLAEEINRLNVDTSSSKFLSVYDQVPLRRYERYSSPLDPEWTNQWPLKNTGQVGDQYHHRDLNVEPAWLQGFTGEGVSIAIVDDGIMYTHKDLADNFVPEWSYDVVDNDDNVYPSLSRSTGRPRRHGTSCAGVTSMVRNNTICGVGVAYNARLVGVRLLSDYLQYDSTEARALGHRSQLIDIYSNSWGPADDGITIEGPGRMTQAVLQHGVSQGRRGKGSVYVWASGNGGQHGDTCSTDGYASSRYTIAVGSIDQTGQNPYYEENCPAKMVVTFHHHRLIKEDSRRLQTVTTSTDSAEACRDSFVGTSVACPLVTGAVALALQANPELSWRDIQYLLVYTSRSDGVGLASDWSRNGAGLFVSEKYGFGAVDAEALVSRAQQWHPVTNASSCSQHQPLITFQPSRIKAGEMVSLYIPMLGCSLQFLEHVILEVSLEVGGARHTYSQSQYHFYQSLGQVRSMRRLLEHSDVRRGDISITMTSPSGQTSVLLPKRPRDFVNSQGYHKWPFMTVLHWGETPYGLWRVNVSYIPSPRARQRGYITVTLLNLTVHGTLYRPASVASIPPQCHPTCQGKCRGAGPGKCDVCKSLRDVDTLHCTSQCSQDHVRYGKYCLPQEDATTVSSPFLSSSSASTAELASGMRSHPGDTTTVYTSPFLSSSSDSTAELASGTRSQTPIMLWTTSLVPLLLTTKFLTE